MRKLIIVIPIFLLVFNKINAQEHDHHEHHNLIELGVGTGVFYSLHEKEVSSGMHIHGLYNINKFGLGIGYESVFAHELHQNISAILAYRPTESIELSIAPGVLLENEETGKNLPSLHFEAIYLFEVGKSFHLGPVISYSYADADQHIMLGIHIGIPLFKEDHD